MSIRCWKSFGLAVLMACITAMTVSAKGGFSFITIGGGELDAELRTSDVALTEDFFAFADFYRDRVEAPADPGVGYEITRYYVDGGREIPFDRLHYYPASGFVYYDGIVNGSSEYDKKWYSARAETRSVFESFLAGALTTRAQPLKSEKQTNTQPESVFNQSNPGGAPTELIFSIAAGIAVTMVIFFSRRGSSLNKRSS